MVNANHRPLSEIARDIREDYARQGKPVYYAAKPYVDALATLTNVTDSYYMDSAESILRYTLSNLGTWRGDKAREVKQEIRGILGLK